MKDLVRLIEGDPDGSGFMNFVVESLGEPAVDPQIVEGGVKILSNLFYGRDWKSRIARDAPSNPNAYFKGPEFRTDHNSKERDVVKITGNCLILYYHIDGEQARRAFLAEE
ncbi:MAG: hypothetical protein ABH849_03340 [Nanoarchaeota archaeon]